jgi:uncharacterized protein
MRISKQTERRFVLGLQGLWPGRRWTGRAGLREALSVCRRVQVDPLDVVGHNEDLVFASRVEGYRPADLERLLYRERAGFEFGGTVSILPKDTFPLHCSWVANEGLPVRWERWYVQHAAVVERVLGAIDARGPLSADDLSHRTRIQDYRSRTLEGLALYVLWRRLDLLIHHREDGRKFYDRSERLLGRRPATWSKPATLRAMALETLSWLGLSGRYGISYLRTNEAGRGRSRVTKREIRQWLIDDGRLREVEVEGETAPSVVRTDQVPLLEAVASGEVPRAWRPIDATPEALLLGPLDIVFARDRGRSLFDFEYVWEVYKPPAQRRWGYYVLPVLLGDRLIGRVEPVRDQRTGALRIARAWWEAGVRLADVTEPLARGLRRFAHGLDLQELDLGDVGPPSFRSALETTLHRAAA